MRSPLRLDLQRWTWRSFVATTLLPLLVVEVVLLGAYVSVSILQHRASVSTLRELAEDQLMDRVDSEASTIEARLASVEHQVAVYASLTRVALDTPSQPDAEAAARYRTRDDGAFVLDAPPPRASSVFYSGLHPIGPDERRKAMQTAQLDPLMAHTVTSNPLIAQVYLNTWDSMNRIYPPVDVDGFPAKMDIPSYNFYYLANKEHNPDGGVVWTDAYLDPAGAGWITSAIAPVYGDSELEGVVGVDVTLETLVDAVLGVHLPWGGYAILVDERGSLLALPPAGESDFGVSELTQHEYDGAVHEDTPKPAEYDLFQRRRTAQLAERLVSSDHGIADIDLNGDRLVTWNRIEGPGWYLVLVVPRASIYASADQTRANSLRAGAGLLAGIVLFYGLVLLVLYRRSKRHIAVVARPLSELRAASDTIMAGSYEVPAVRSEIREIDEVAAHVVAMGRALGQQLSELRDKEAALVEAHERESAARAASEAKTAFLAHVSHEIRTPMNGVLGTLQLFERGGLSEQQARSLRVVERSATALLTLIDDLLQASRVQHGTFEVEQIPFDLDASVHDAVALFAPSAGAAGVALELEVELDSDGAIGDPARLRQVLTNLLSNALKFTERGRVSLRAQRTGDEVLFEIEDTGIGIPEERLDAIFDAFTQADVTTTRRFGGTGLGLTISAGLVKGMGGELSVRSEVGVGTCFSFSLPMPAAAVPSQSPYAVDTEAREPAACDEPLSVLVAEDNEVNQTIILAMLARLGHTAHLVEDGHQAIEAAAKGDFDVALFDVHMPNMDGRDATRHLRRQARTKDLTIIALTASVMPEDERLCLEAGMDLVLAKPLSITRLRDALDTARTARPQGHRAG